MAETKPQGPTPLTRDALVTKTVLQPGEDDPAGRGARVRMSYKLRLSDALDAQPIDSSAALRGGALKFTTGRGKVIPALELAAQSMCAGERATVCADARYAFGSAGLKRCGVPGDATVFLEVEMLGFEGGEKVKPLEEMTPRERFDKAKVFKEEGNQLFKEVKFEKAMMSYSQCIRLLSNVFYKADVVDGEKAAADAKNVDVQSVEQATESKDGSDTPDATQGATDVPNGKPDESGFDEAEVVDATNAPAQTSESGEEAGDEVEFIDVSTASRSEDADDTTKAKGDSETGATMPNGVAEKSEDASEASSKENKENNSAQDEAEGDEDLPQNKEITSLHVTTLNNLSLCLIKMEEYRRAVESATLALRLDDGSSKALYYRGRALEALGEWDKARDDLTAAAKIQPNNVGIRMEIAKLEKKRKVHHSLERKQAAAMFA